MEPIEIRNKEFNRRLWGLDQAETRAYLDKIADFIEGLYAEQEGLRRQLAETSRALSEFQRREQGLQAALAQTREMAEEIKANAEREAQLTVAQAELQAEKILGQAHNRLAQIHDDMGELKRQRVQFEVRLRSLVEAHLKLLDMENDRDRELNELEDKIKILRSPSS